MEIIVAARNEVGEGVLWCERTGRVLWVDIHGAALWAHHPRSGATASWPMPERLAVIALTQDDDRLLLGLESSLAWFSFSSEAVTPICAVEAGMTTRINDGRCDRMGNFVFGTMDESEPRAKVAAYYRLNGADLSLEKLALAPCAIANSICFSPDGATLYYCDSPQRTIRRCDYPSLARERVFAVCRGEGFADGSCIDAEGFLWNAQWGGARVVRYAPDGAIATVLDIPARQPTCVAIGGPAMDMLFCSSATLGLAPPDAADGALLGTRLAGIRGLPESRFGA